MARFDSRVFSNESKVIGLHTRGDVVERQAEIRSVIGASPAQHGVARRLQGFPRLAFVERREVRHDSGLDGKQLQHAFAKGVDGLDLEAARSFKRAGEELAGAFEDRRIGRS